ncbi:hypothetical protein [Pseudofrankia sp. DC12]|uniref:hypothetical protein n=1 Tax=Pseudofrankia sp. DC12 TaxID=683315 RepID=UPI0005F81713|nr:hypothetical protein [Pseudofrankia sp. DC12]
MTFGPATAIVCGFAITGAATAVLAGLLTLQGRQVSVGWLVTGLGLVGLGNTFILPSYLGAALSDVRPHQAGAASGTLNTIQQLAGSAGLAAIGAVFFAARGPHPTHGEYARTQGRGKITVRIDQTTLLVWSGLEKC